VIAITLSSVWWFLGTWNQSGRDATHSFHHNTQHPHSGATAATLHLSHTIDPESNTWRFLGSMAAIQQSKIDPLRAIIQEVTGLNGVLAIRELDNRSLHNHYSDPGSDCARLLGSTPAAQRYKGRLCRIRTHEIADHYGGGCLHRSPAAPRARSQTPSQPQSRF